MKSLLQKVANRVLTWVSPSRRRHALVGPARLWKLKRDFQFKVLRDRGLQPEDRFLDIGCGTLRGGIPIIRYLARGRYMGLDIRPEVFPAALREVAKHGLIDKRPLLLAADVTRLDLRHEFDVVWAFSVFIHLSDEKLERCFRFIANHLAPGGRCLGNVNLGLRPESSWREFPVVARPREFYRQRATGAGLLMEDLGSLRELGHQSGVAAQDEQRLLRLELAS